MDCPALRDENGPERAGAVAPAYRLWARTQGLCISPDRDARFWGFGRGHTSIVICSYASVDLERVRFARLRLPYPFVS